MINRIYWTSYGKFVVICDYQTYEFDDEEEAEDLFGRNKINEYYMRTQEEVRRNTFNESNYRRS